MNPAQLGEVELNFMANRIRDLMREKETLKEKEDIFFLFMKKVNMEGYLKLIEWYTELDNVEREDFIIDVIDNGIYLEEPPMYNNTTIEQMADIYETFNIKPVNAYVKFNGKMQKILNPIIAAEKYVLKLKHH